MIWIGLVLGFVVASVFWTLAYSPVVERLQTIEQSNLRNYELLQESLKATRRYEARADMLEYELERMIRLPK